MGGLYINGHIILPHEGDVTFLLLYLAIFEGNIYCVDVYTL